MTPRERAAATSQHNGAHAFPIRQIILMLSVWSASFSGGPVSCWRDLQTSGLVTPLTRMSPVGSSGGSSETTFQIKANLQAITSGLYHTYRLQSICESDFFTKILKKIMYRTTAILWIIRAPLQLG